MFKINRNPSVSDVRIFALVIFTGCAVIGVMAWVGGGALWLWVLGQAESLDLAYNGSVHQVIAIALWIVAVVVPAIALASQSAGRVLYVGWMTLGAAIGTVVTTVLLTVLYFVLLPFFSLIRLGDPLRLRLTHGKDASYWEDHKHHESTLERTARPF